MSAINWNVSELKISMTPIGRPAGRTKQVVSVYSAYGDLKPRLVQTVADMVDGETVYISARDKSGKVLQTIPVIEWRNGNNSDNLLAVFAFIDTAYSKGMDVIVYGATRALWLLSVSCGDMVSNCLDNMTDKGLAAGSRPNAFELVEANGLRIEF